MKQRLVTEVSAEIEDVCGDMGLLFKLKIEDGIDESHESREE